MSKLSIEDIEKRNREQNEILREIKRIDGVLASISEGIPLSASAGISNLSPDMMFECDKLFVPVMRDYLSKKRASLAQKAQEYETL